MWLCLLSSAGWGRLPRVPTSPRSPCVGDTTPESDVIVGGTASGRRQGFNEALGGHQCLQRQSFAVSPWGCLPVLSHTLGLPVPTPGLRSLLPAPDSAGLWFWGSPETSASPCRRDGDLSPCGACWDLSDPLLALIRPGLGFQSSTCCLWWHHLVVRKHSPCSALLTEPGLMGLRCQSPWILGRHARLQQADDRCWIPGTHQAATSPLPF